MESTDSAKLTDDLRKEFALNYGLSETTSWSTILKQQSADARKELAVKYGLPKTASWSKINEYSHGISKNKLSL
tara:strand:+ start:5900 stop:6121 length:222 start_codon:yes stop_codon:yes gene_type:complete